MACPDLNTLQALPDLADAEREAILDHADGCDECRKLLAAMVRERVATADDLPPPRPATLPAGTQVGRYRVEGLLGVGGLGVVYAAHDPQLGRRVALKLLKSNQGQSQDRLMREARAMARISHPHVVAVYDVGTWEDRVFVAMELISGRDLRVWLAERPREPREIARAFIAAGRGLTAAHAAGIIHRDFKPENVLVGDDGRVRVTDFGLARAREDALSLGDPAAVGSLSTALTQEGTVLGTPVYMAPEQHMGAADARSDQFAFSAALHEALYGTRPFTGANYEALRAAVLAGRRTPTPPGKTIPAGVKRVMERGLSRGPTDRWPSLEAMLDRLGRAAAQRPLRLVALSGALLAVLALAFAADVLLRRRESDVTRESFAAARRAVEHGLSARYERFVELAKVSAKLADPRSGPLRADASGPDGIRVRSRAGGLEVAFTRGEFAEVFPARALLAELAVDSDLLLGLATDAGQDGSVPAELHQAASRAAGDTVPARLDGRLWLVQSAPLAQAPAALVLARPVAGGLAGLFPGARHVLLWSGAASLLLFAASLWRWRRLSR